MMAGLPTSLDGLGRAISVIIVSEIGDKTFLIAAILSMRHPRMTIFAGSIAALALMSLLSSLLGTIVPTLLPKRWTTAAAAVLFFVFGAKMLQEGLEMESGEKARERMEEEMREVQKEVEEAEEEIAGISSTSTSTSGIKSQGLPYSVSDLEEGQQQSSAPLLNQDEPLSTTTRPRRNSLSTSKDAALSGIKEGVKNLAHLFFSPIFIQAFVLTFLAEWGDRSQITTIALAAAHNVWLVTFGTTLGHSLCTAMAVISGRWISQHISVKHVTLGGAVLFLLFGFVYTYETIYFEDESAPLSLWE
ncbi:GCR1-dependent translation factor 1 [Microbotryomycetes sp. JL221]|nr:GCR1-dependent translation factor 1 [Microbotryomycetes sp. JL221]